MIKRLRRKLVVVLMTFLSLLLVAILAGMFFSAKALFERRSTFALSEPPPKEEPVDAKLRMALPIAIVTADAGGGYSVPQNQIHYVSDTELIQIAQTLQNEAAGYGTISDYNLRYRRHVNADGMTEYLFSDTFLELDSLKSQFLSSIVIGISALAMFWVVSILLSRWMVKPVARAWEKQRQFVTDASHELKTPLTVILSNANMMLESADSFDAPNKQRLDNIRAESKRMKALTESLLNLARADSRKDMLVREDVDLSFIVSSAALLFEPGVFDLGRSLCSEIQEGIHVAGDREMLRRLADILIDNAVQYGADGSPITVTLAPYSKKEVLLSVRSEGTPLSVKDLTQIFERFYRVDASRGQTRGFGLGLSIARSIAEEHGGKLWAETDGQRSNTFYVRLPLQPKRQSD